MPKCSQCKQKFPDDLVQPMCVDGDYINVCGVCALNVVREVHGVPDYEFPEDSVARYTYDRTKAIKDKRNGA